MSEQCIDPLEVRAFGKASGGRSEGFFIVDLSKSDDNSSEKPEWLHNANYNECIGPEGMDQQTNQSGY